MPDDWLAFWREGASSHDPNNAVGDCHPEMKVIPDAFPFKGPNRVYSDSEEPTAQKSVMYFAFGKIMDACIYQQVTVQPGARLCATAWAEGWSNDGLNLENANKDNPRWSEGLGVGLNAFYAEEGAVTDDAARNLRFRVGIDPTGGADAWAATAVWAIAAPILFDVSDGADGARSAWRWILVPDRAGAYTPTLSAAGSPSATTMLQVSP